MTDRKLTRLQLKELFPNARLDFIEANRSDRNTGEAPIVERGHEDEPLPPDRTKEGESPRFLVRFTSIRKRLLDEDNMVGKFLTDCLRYASIIPNDDPLTTSIEMRQEKAGKRDERVIVEVFERI